MSNSGKIKPVCRYSALKVYFFVLFHPSTWKPTLRFVATAAIDFFWLQFRRKLGLLKTKIIHVDSPLDEFIPFKPENIDIYLDFINFWLRPLSMLIALRRKTAAKRLSDFLVLINRCYKEAADFYKFRMSTTKRPEGIAHIKFFWIKLLDPHYLCVPSLHVSVVVLTFTYFKRVFKEENFTEEEQNFYNTEIYAEAMEIAETVLYIKQHSVNCVAAALYMMNCILEGEFSIQDAVDFINNMFANADDITDEHKNLINEHLNMLFEQLLLEGTNEYDWVTPLKRWILQCEKDETEQESSL
ncbi:MAG: hypothetical protein IKZ86_13870 [Spirochaetaceae bacterium]|nr:hypothetical protein [Spirochaetaceae bacterium]